MDPSQYRDEVATNRRKHGFDAVDDRPPDFERLWMTRDDDDSIGAVTVLATLVEAADPEPEDLTAAAEALRETLADRVDPVDRGSDGGATTPLGYVTFAVPEADPSLVEAATSYTVARRRTNVFPLVYDCERETLHRHEVPRLKGRGIYRRQARDAERLFDV